MLRCNPLRYARPRHKASRTSFDSMYFSREASFIFASKWLDKVDEITDRYVVCDFVVGPLARRTSRSSDTLSSITFLCSRYYIVYDTSSSVIYSTVSILSFVTLPFVLLSRLHPNVLFSLNGSAAYICLCETFNV